MTPHDLPASELAPCACCGRQPTLDHVFRLLGPHETDAELIAAWNRRAGKASELALYEKGYNWDGEKWVAPAAPQEKERG